MKLLHSLRRFSSLFAPVSKFNSLDRSPTQKKLQEKNENHKFIITDQTIYQKKKELVEKAQDANTLKILPDEEIHTAAIRTFEAECCHLMSEAKIYYNSIANNIKTKINSVQSSLDRYTVEERISIHKGELSAQYKHNSEPIRRISAEIEEIQHKIEICIRQKTLLSKKINKKYNNTFTQKSLLDYSNLEYIFLASIFSVEIPVIFSGLQVLGEIPNVMAYIIAIGFSLVLAFTAHTTGGHFANKKKIEAQLFLASGVFLNLVMVFLRFKASASPILTLLGVTLFGLAVIVAHSFKQRQNYIADINEAKRLSDEIIQLSVTKKDKIEQRDIEIKHLKDRSQYLPLQNAKDEVFKLEEEKRSAKLELETIHTQLEQTFSKIKNFFQIGCAAYYEAETEFRTIKNLPPSKASKLKYQLKTNNNSSSSSIKQNGILLTASTIILMGLSSCHSNQEHHIYTIFDKTDTMITSYDTEKIIDYIQDDIIGFKEKNQTTYNGIVFKTTTISAKSVTPECTSHLKIWQYPLLAIEKERKLETQKFFAKARSCLEEYDTPSKENHSLVYIKLASVLEKIAQKSGNRYVLIFSDMCEHSEWYSFYNAKADNYDTIKEKLEFAKKLGDLSGIEIVVVHEPSVRGDPTFRLAKNFFGKYFSEKGAQIHFLPNL